MNRTIITFAIALVGMIFASEVAGQSLFDEMIVDGETVSIDSVKPDTNAHHKAAPTQAEKHREAIMKASEERARRARKAAMKRRGIDNPLWEMTDSEGNLLEPEDFGAVELNVDSTMDVSRLTLPAIAFMPPIYSGYSTALAIADPTVMSADSIIPDNLTWADLIVRRDHRRNAFVQNFMMQNPGSVRYNLEFMPRPPKEFVMEVDPEQAKINVREFTRDEKALKEYVKPVELPRINWLKKFDASLQFSQAYVSPNWYQGGNSNLNAILNLLYDVKLNPAFHPDLIFETSMQYKLGANTVPDDTVHGYNISEDLLQINSKFGYKAVKRWYYSVTVQFKTQLLNSYNTNSNRLKSAFLSPGELNVGLGMTYSNENKKKTMTFTAAVSPLSYNLKMCTNSKLNPTWFGIEEGKKTISQYGSSSEMTFRWKMTYNIEYFSRMFIFTNYEYLQGDWEHTVSFNINKYLSTRLYAHLRYQSDAKKIEDTRWNKWQLKEILSIGFSYRFSRS